MISRLKQIHQKDWIALFIISLGLIVLNYNYGQRLDVFSDDDDLYWGFGMDYLKGKYRGPDDGALYCLWQLAIEMMTKNPTTTYYVNWILMASLPCLALFFLLRSLYINTWISTWLILLYMFSGLNYPLLPKLTHFAIMILAIGLGLSNQSKTLIQRLTIAGLGVWLASYVRPEMYLACLLILGWVLILSFKQRTYKYFIGFFVTVLISGIVFGTPIRKNDRSFWTYKVYFAINYMEWYPNEIKLSPWMHFNEINEQIYGHKLESIMDAVKSRPDYAVRHVQTNILKLGRDSLRYAQEYGKMLVDILPIPYKRYLLPLLLLALATFVNYRKTWLNIRNMLAKNWSFGIILFLTLVPSIVATTFFYPRPHYFLYHFYLLYLPLTGLLLANISFRPLLDKSKFSGTIPQMGVNLFLVFLFLWPYFKTASQNKPTPKKDFIEVLQSLDLPQKVNLLGGEPITYQRYVGEGWRFYYFDNERPVNFIDFLKEKNINCIDITPNMNGFFEKDTSYQEFLKNPRQFGFQLRKQTANHQVFSLI